MPSALTSIDARTVSCRDCGKTFVHLCNNTEGKRRVKRCPGCQKQHRNNVRADRFRSNRKKYKTLAVEAEGGKCSLCGFVSEELSIYDFHHTDGGSKENGLTNLFARGRWDLIEKELLGCVLVCANCHRLLHHGNQEEVVNNVSNFLCPLDAWGT